jgi:hypothetical protein
MNRQGYVIPSTAQHDLSPDARLVVKFGPRTPIGKAVNTSRARSAVRTMAYLLTTVEGLRMHRKLSKSQRGRRRLVDIYYRRALAVALHRYNGDAKRALREARNARRRAHTMVKRESVALKQRETYARAMRLAPVVDRADPMSSHYAPASDAAHYTESYCTLAARQYADPANIEIQRKREGNRITLDYDARYASVSRRAPGTTPLYNAEHRVQSGSID